MLSHWPIRRKLFLGIALLLVTMAVLAFSGFRGVYAYRGLARGVSRRAMELPLATKLARRVGDLRIILGDVQSRGEFFGDHAGLDLGHLEDFDSCLYDVHILLGQYKDQVRENQSIDARIGRNLQEWDREWATVGKFEASLQRLNDPNHNESWVLVNKKLEGLSREVEQLERLAAELPSFLQRRMLDFSDQVRGQYRTWIVLTWVSSLLAAVLLCLLGRLCYQWVFQPLRTLIHASRRVAAGDFDHSIHLESKDEMADLAGAMNAMTSRFRDIRNELDQQVRQRTKQVVRNEQLASVGFLAAGVAHEINNPLASIALCAESLEERIGDILPQHRNPAEQEDNEQVGVLRTYLRMIQDEAFRCKEITGQLLDFSRIGDVEHQHNDLRILVDGVIEMVRHIGKYKQKYIHFEDGKSVMAPVNSQEIKQVVLNLLTNGLDSVNPGGTVTVGLTATDEHAILDVWDDGCGMSEDVLEHVFEPFFTRRRDGQGTGLGLSISYRIVAEHGGNIDAESDGPGRGSHFRVTLPLSFLNKEQNHPRQAA